MATCLALLGSCGRSTTPTTPPTTTDPTEDGIRLSYTPTGAPLHHELTVELTHTSLGLYLEAKVGAEAELSTRVQGSGLRSTWTLRELSTLELSGTVGKGDPEAVRSLLTSHGPIDTDTDDRGVASSPGEEEPLVRAGTAEGLSPSAMLVLAALGEPTRLPRLPAEPLRLGEPVEHEEESETVLTDAGTVLPTTTVHRYTLRGVDDTGVAEVAIELASVAESDAAEDADADASGDAEPAPTMRVEIRAQGTLLFDVEHGLPLSLELSRSEQFEVGEQEVERSLLTRSRWSAP